MVIYNVKIAPDGELSPQRLRIGRFAENEAVKIQFDFSGWQETYGEASVSLIAKRCGDSYPYPIVITSEENIATWVVSNTDTSKCGIGYAELGYSNQSGMLAKSALLMIEVVKTLSDAGDPPDPYDSWIDDMTDLFNEYKAYMDEAVERADEAVERANEAVEQAQEALEQAQEAVETATESAESAEASADRAQEILDEIEIPIEKIDAVDERLTALEAALNGNILFNGGNASTVEGGGA